MTMKEYMNIMNKKLEDCHNQIHNGKYSPEEIKTLKLRVLIYQSSVDYWISTRLNNPNKVEEPKKCEHVEVEWFNEL